MSGTASGSIYHPDPGLRGREIDIANLMSAMLKQAGVEMEVVLVAKFDWNAGYDGFLAGFCHAV